MLKHVNTASLTMLRVVTPNTLPTLASHSIYLTYLLATVEVCPLTSNAAIQQFTNGTIAIAESRSVSAQLNCQLEINVSINNRGDVISKNLWGFSCLREER